MTPFGLGLGPNGDLAGGDKGDRSRSFGESFNVATLGVLAGRFMSIVVSGVGGPRPLLFSSSGLSGGGGSPPGRDVGTDGRFGRSGSRLTSGKLS